MISQKIQTELAVAMKAKDELLVSTYRMLLSAFNYEKIEKQHELTHDEEIAVIKREVKKRNDTVAALQKAQLKPESTSSTPEQIATRLIQEEAEIKLLKSYLPPEIGIEEVEKAVMEAITETGAVGSADFGKVMKSAMAKLQGKADGSRISEIVKKQLEK